MDQRNKYYDSEESDGGCVGWLIIVAVLVAVLLLAALCFSVVVVV